MSDQYPETKPVSYQYELATLAEESGEVTQIVGKILRFGYDSYNPFSPQNGDNLHLLHAEIGDFLAATEFAAERGLLDKKKLETNKAEKVLKLNTLAPPVFHPVETRPVEPEKVYLHKETTKSEKIIAVAIVVALIALPVAAFVIGRSAHQVAENVDYKVEAAAMAARCYEKSIDLNACADYARLAGRPDLIPPPVASPYKK